MRKNSPLESGEAMLQVGSFGTTPRGIRFAVPLPS